MNTINKKTFRFVRGCLGFTAVEAVVGAGLLALLGALALPTLQTAQSSVDAARCMTNERQLGIANLQYAMDHGNRLPSLYSPTWAVGLVAGGYLTSTTQLTCPTKRSQCPTCTDMTSSYGYSDWLDWSGSGNCPKNIKQIPEPARTPAIVDCDNYRFLRPSWDGWQVWFYPIPRHNQRLNVLWLDGHASLITTNELETSPYWGQIFIQCQ